MNNYYYTTKNDELYHHGILGMKWGVRRYQNPDGSLTAAGRQRYGYSDKRVDKDTGKIHHLKGESSETRKIIDDHNKMSDKEFKSKYYVSKKTYEKRTSKYLDPSRSKNNKNRTKLTSTKSAQKSAEKIAKYSQNISTFTKKYKNTGNSFIKGNAANGIVINAYKIAQEKAKQDPSYKNSSEYKDIKKNYNTMITGQVFLGALWNTYAASREGYYKGY